MKTKKSLAYLVALTLALLLVARCADCEEKPDKLYRISQGVLIGGTVADYISSRPTPGTREANPNMPSNRAAQAGVMIASSGLTFFVTHMAHRSGHRKAAIWGNMLMGGIHAGAAGWNFSLEMRLK